MTLTGTTTAWNVSITDHVTTSGNGNYLFTEPPGTYQIAIGSSNFAPGGTLATFTPSPVNKGNNPALSSSPNPSPTSPATLGVGQNDLTVDFGYFQNVVAGTPTIAGNQLQVPLTNNESTGVTVSKIVVSWPAANGNLQQVALNGPIYNTSTAGPTATITTFTGPAGNISIPAGKNANLNFQFANNPGPGTYTVTLTFADGTTVTATLTVLNVAAGTPTRSGPQLQVPLTNNETTAVTVSKIVVSWPTANGNLQQVALNGPIYNTSTAGPTATITTFTGPAGNISIPAGKNANLNFQFQNPAVSGTYSIDVSFTDGTTVNIDNTVVPELAAGSTSQAGAGVSELLGGIQLKPGDIKVAVDLPSGTQTTAQEAAIESAIATLNAEVAPLGIHLIEVSGAEAASASVILSMASTSSIGGVAQGVLGAFSPAQQENITLISGWNWYYGSNPNAIAADQYDFQTVVTHELGHALGLGENADPSSAMDLYPDARSDPSHAWRRWMMKCHRAGTALPHRAAPPADSNRPPLVAGSSRLPVGDGPVQLYHHTGSRASASRF